MLILAIDDDDFILEILSETILTLGYPQPLLAANGADALRLLESSTSKIDCVLLDIQMPGMNGVEVCSELRKMPRHLNTPVIMLTAMADQDYVNRAFAVGATDYLTKPFELLEIKARLGMAERLVEETKREESATQALGEFVDTFAHRPKIAISEPFAVRDIPGCISFKAFENYVHQLQRGAYYSLVVTALRITNVTNLFEQSVSQDFSNLIIDVAEAISDNIPGQVRLFSYCGNGNYLCVSDVHESTISEDFYLNVQSAIVQMGLVFSNGAPIDVEIVQGKSCRPGVFSQTGNTSILKRTIDDVEHSKPQEEVSGLFKFG